MTRAGQLSRCDYSFLFPEVFATLNGNARLFLALAKKVARARF